MGMLLRRHASYNDNHKPASDPEPVAEPATPEPKAQKPKPAKKPE